VFIAPALVGPSKQLEQVFQFEHNIVKYPNWPEQTSWLFTTVAENLKAGLQVQHADHSATMLIGQTIIQSFDCIIVIWENRHENDEDSHV